MVGVVAGDDLPQPLPLPGNGLVHPPSQLLLDHPELRLHAVVRLHAVAAGLPIDLEVTSTRLATNAGKAQEREGLRLAKSGLPSPRRARFAAARRPNSIRRVLSGCSDSANSCNRSRIASQKRWASASCSKPTTISSA